MSARRAARIEKRRAELIEFLAQIALKDQVFEPVVDQHAQQQTLDGRPRWRRVETERLDIRVRAATMVLQHLGKPTCETSKTARSTKTSEPKSPA